MGTFLAKKLKFYSPTWSIVRFFVYFPSVGDSDALVYPPTGARGEEPH